jgi:hypothetical protein
MNVDYEKLMTWARAHAPITPSLPCGPYMAPRRRVRLEIAAVQTWEPASERFSAPGPEIVVARAYLAEPRCQHDKFAWLDDYHCECGPLAQTRIR